MFSPRPRRVEGVVNKIVLIQRHGLYVGERLKEDRAAGKDAL